MTHEQRDKVYRSLTEAVAKGVDCDLLHEIVAGLDDRGFFDDQTMIYHCSDMIAERMLRLGCGPEEVLWAGVAAIGERAPIHTC